MDYDMQRFQKDADNARTRAKGLGFFHDNEYLLFFLSTPCARYLNDVGRGIHLLLFASPGTFTSSGVHSLGIT